MDQRDSVRRIKGVGEKAEALFAKVGVNSVGELLEYYPRSYDIFTPIEPIAQATEGKTMVFEVTLAARPKLVKRGNLKILSVPVKDKSGQLMVTWFNMPYMASALKLGVHYIMRGKVIARNGRLHLQQPKILQPQEYANKLHRLQPVYPLIAGLTNNAVTKAISKALEEIDLNGDFLPLDIRKKYDLMPHKKAVREIHFPANEENYFAARDRLVFEEFYLFSMALNHMKQGRKKSDILCSGDDMPLVDSLIENLPFSLTEGQNSAWEEICQDLASGYVMNRLIQGDVGSGKTILAVLALLAVAEQGHQGAIMVPTEVLAEQHFLSFEEYLSPLGIRVGLLTGSMKAAQKREMHKKIANHEVDILVGTHALIQDKVEYADLAMVVTDEQHRFGVKQREGLYQKGREPHMLVMSATPIPRTLAIILYGDLDVSVIHSMPQGRLPIQNCVVGTDFRPQSYRFIAEQVSKGHQAYVICPMVEESENMEAENVIDYTDTLRQQLPPSVRVQYLHGKMKPSQKNEIMHSYAAGEIDVLVSTTVIEVGINVPNATVMMVENAERFGLAQLHQLRGRVGRGQSQSYCIFMAGNTSKENRERLKVLEDSNDGFFVAKEDLRLRGPGDLFGIRQSGELGFKLADIYQDAAILQQANEAVRMWEGLDLLEFCSKNEGVQKRLEMYCKDAFL